MPQPYAALPEPRDAVALTTAKSLMLNILPASPAATGLISQITAAVATQEAAGRARKRSVAEAEGLARAACAIICGVLWRWSSETPHLAYHVSTAEAFTGHAVSVRNFRSARDCLAALGLITHVGGVRYHSERLFGSGWAGHAGRYAPTLALLTTAVETGLTPSDRRQDFSKYVSTTPPAAMPAAVLREFTRWRAGKKVTAQPLAFNPNAPRVLAAVASVEAHNAFAAQFDVTGCVPPRWYRAFRGDFRLGGRWQPLGGTTPESAYLQLPERERVEDIRIDGERVVEIDVVSAHLTIMHGLCGLPRPPGDLYAVVPGIPRGAVKDWTTAAIGVGKARPRWPKSTEGENLKYDPKVIRDAMVVAYPFLADMQSVVPKGLREAYGKESTLVALYIQAVEAAALTHAMAVLQDAGILALPTHDGMVVRASAEGAGCAALRGGVVMAAGIMPQLDVTR